MKLRSHVLSLPLASLAFHFLLLVSSDMVQPFYGQGTPPNPPNFELNEDQRQGPQKYTEIFVSVFVEKILQVDDENYKFQAAVYIRMSWFDPMAQWEIDRRTNETFGDGRPLECSRACEKGESKCCDSVWLPGTQVANLVDMEGTGVDTEVIQTMRTNQSNVQWLQRVIGTFYTQMQLRKFPFDKQYLVIEFWKQDCCYFYTPSSTSPSVPTRIPGLDIDSDQVPGWQITNVSLVSFPFDVRSLFQEVTAANEREVYTMASMMVDFVNGDQMCPSTDSNICQSTELDANEFPTKIALIVEVTRFWEYYVYIFILPVLLSVALSWTSFVVSPEQLELRVGTAISLFLALSAQQFVVSEQLPRSSYVTSMALMVIWSYVLIVAAVVQSLLVSFLFEWGKRGMKHKKKSLEISKGIGTRGVQMPLRGAQGSSLLRLTGRSKKLLFGLKVLSAKLNKNPKKVIIVVNTMDAMSLVIFPLVYVAGLYWIFQ